MKNLTFKLMNKKIKLQKFEISKNMFLKLKKKNS
jgi:hypothetical protein